MLLEWAVSVFLTAFSSVGLVATFYAVCVVCDGHLVPAVEVFIQQLRIPEDIAGVTFVAFGSAAPELFLNTVAAFEKDSSDLSLPAVLGSAVIAFGLIPSLCILCGRHKEDSVQLSAWPILRETFFYLLGLATFCMAIEDGEIEYSEALGLILVYCVYVGSVAGFYIIASWPNSSSPYSSDNNLRADSDDDAADSPLVGSGIGGGGGGGGGVGGGDSISSSPGVFDALPSKLSSSISPTSSVKSRAYSYSSGGPSPNSNSNSNSNPNLSIDLHKLESEDVEDVPQHTSTGGGELRLLKLVFKSAWDYITVPVDRLVSALFPALQVVGHEPASGATSSSSGSGVGGAADSGGKRAVVSVRSAVCSLAACVVGISVLAYAIIELTKLLVAQIGVGTTTVGATLVSLGAEIPDTISSISLARNGHNDGAMAGAIGSQVINITLGVGLPALISCWLYGGSLLIEPEQIKRCVWFAFTTRAGGLRALDSPAFHFSPPPPPHLHTRSRSLWLLTFLVFVVVLGYAGVSLPIFRLLSCTISRYTSIRRPGALFLIVLWVVCNVGFVITNEEMRQ